MGRARPQLRWLRNSKNDRRETDWCCQGVGGEDGMTAKGGKRAVIVADTCVRQNPENCTLQIGNLAVCVNF